MTGRTPAQVIRRLRRSGVQAHLLLVALLVAALMAYVYVTQSMRSPVPDHGDVWADIVHILGARNLDQYGFFLLRLGMTADNGPEVGLPPRYLAHHPSFPAVLLAILYRLGLSTVQARVAPLMFAGSALVATYLLASRMTGDRRTGIIALLTLSVSAPFRLLSDSFCYVSYDLAAEAWGFLFITLGSLAGGRRQRLWLIIAGATAFLTITLSGFEMVPALAAYSVLFPLLFAPLAPRDRLRVALMAGLLVTGGFVAGVLARLAHNAWMLGGLKEALDDLIQIYLYRSSTGYGAYWGQPYLIALVYRVGAYYPMHVIGLALALITRRLMALTGRGRVSPPPVDLRWLGLLFLCESLWFVLFRQHSHMHAHTVYHLSLTMSLTAATYITAAWNAMGRPTPLRAVAAVVGVGLSLASLASAGVRPYGNLQIAVDWTPRWRLLDRIEERLPADGLVVLDSPADDSATEFFLGRTFVRRSGVVDQLDAHGRPVFLLTHPGEHNEAYTDGLARYRLVALNEDLALFDAGSRPGLLNAVTLGPVREESLSRGTSTLGFLLHPGGRPVGGAVRSVTVPLPPGEAEAIAFRAGMAAPGAQEGASASLVFTFDSTDFISLPASWSEDGQAGAGDIRLTFSLSTEAGSTLLLREFALDQGVIRATPGGTPVEVSVPAREAPATLRVEASCAESGDCEAGWVWLAPAAAWLQ